MKNYAYLALVLFVFMAGCTQQQSGTGTQTGTQNQQTETPEPHNPVSSTGVSVSFEGIPSSMQPGESKTYYMVIKNNFGEPVSDLRVYSYNFGTYLESSCSGARSIGSLGAGEEKRVSCRLTTKGEPVSRVDQEIGWETDYVISSRSGQLKLEVLEEETSGSPNRFSFRAPLDGFFEVSPDRIKEGDITDFSLSLNGNVVEIQSCKCSITEITIQVPKGFDIQGLEGWDYSSCGDMKCYTKKSIKLPFDESFTGSIAGVVKAETFYFPIVVKGIGAKSEGSVTVSVLPSGE